MFSRGAPRRSTRIVFGVLMAVAQLSGCSGGGSGAGDDAARQIAEANDRLRGEWLLVEFRPQVGLEPMLAQLLAMQVGRLVANFDGQRLFATGVGVQATRTYRVDEADVNRVKLTLFDENGVRYDVRGEFQGDVLRFESRTSPWTGQGALQRRAAPR